ncbi:MAG: bifunctional diaminohydroxyphosphoribosylaminopyrimidine deaminase/5-amino-6-(5-phosphoribosylamino)uracil reductase RibD [Lachnospiraceae bacterium]|nr:bifunctional diaminohydroxyphosphoribosylaminopyrimidine deaminase/5-amino-6-(5-phosphoribosylamino)uracil reductase RibD [Lachnospiraceae bacterium]
MVKNGRIIGEGYHAKYGDLHAERNAFKNLTESAEGAEMYVTLEPCCHFGKQPPCTHAIVEHKIAKVYVGSDDPNEKVAGKGIEYLRENGIEVETRVMKEECDRLNDIFFHYITTGTPYVMMKYAMTLDGKIATVTGKSKWITGEASRVRVQESRHKYMGIMVGINTVLEDDPMLTCRIEGGINPTRIICDSRCRIPLESNIVKTAREVPTILAVNGSAELFEDKTKALENAGIKILQVDSEDAHIDISKLMTELGAMGIDSVMVEGGGTLNDSILKAGVVNEINVYIAPKIFGGEKARTAVSGSGVEEVEDAHLFELRSMEQIDDDVLLMYKKRTSQQRHKNNEEI